MSNNKKFNFDIETDGFGTEKNPIRRHLSASGEESESDWVNEDQYVFFPVIFFFWFVVKLETTVLLDTVNKIYFDKP